MAVCSFLGHHYYIYDRDITLRLADAAEKIVQENDKVDFLLLLSPALSLSTLYLKASLEMKTRYPSKVTVTLLLQDREECERFRLQKHIPPCMVDRVVLAPSSVSKEDDNSLQPLSRWMIRQSTHLISYLYERFYETPNWELYYARKQPGLQVIDITSEETTQRIEDEIRTMPERTQLIFQKLGEGCTLKEIGRLLGLAGSERVRQIRAKASGEMSKAVAKGSNPPAPKGRRLGVCGIFALGDQNSDFSYQTGLAFEHTIEYLRDRFRVTQFKIAAEYGSSVFMYILQRLQKRSGIMGVQITLVTTGDMDSEPAEVPVSHRVENIDTTLSTGDPASEVIQHLLSQSDFCICNLAASSLADEVERYAAQTGGAILLDIGKHISEDIRGYMNWG